MTDRDPDTTPTQSPPQRTTPGDARRPSKESPDSVSDSVPTAAERAGQVGPDAADPPRAGSDEHDADRE